MPPFQLPFQTPDGRTPLQQLRDEYSVPLNERGGIDYDKLRGTFAGPEEAPQQIQQQPQKDPRETAAIRKQIALRAAQRIVKDGNYSAAPRIIRKDGTNEVLPDIQTPAGWFRKESVTSKGEHSGGFGDFLWNRGGEVGGYEITKSRELNDIVSDEDINVMLQDISNRNYAQFGEENTIDPNEFKSLLKTQSLAKAMFTEMVENKVDWGGADENNFKKIFRSLPPNEQLMFSNALDTMTEDGGINEGPIWRFVDSLARGVSSVAHVGEGIANLIGSKSDEQIEGEQIEAGAKALVDAKLEEAGMVGNVFNTAAEILPPMLAGGYVGKGASAVAAVAGAGAKVAGGVGSAAGMGYWFDMTAGDVKDRLRAAGLDDTQATLFATPSAAAIASMELLQVGRLIKGFKGNNAGLLAQVTKNSSGFKEKLLQNTITKAGKEAMKTGLKEGGQEALQQAVEEGTMFLASKMHDSEFDLGESFDNVRNAFTDSVFAMALIGAPGAVSKSLSEKRGIESLRARMAIMDSTVSEKIDELVDLNHGSQDPQNFNELLDWATNPERADEAFPEILRQATEGEGGVLNAPIESVIEFMGDRLKSGVVESINRNRERLLEGRDEAWEYLDTSIEEALGNAKEREGHQGVADILIGHLENNPAIADKFGDLISSGNLSREAFKKLILASGDAFKKDGSVNTETASGKLMLELMDHIEKTGGDAKVKIAAPGTFVVASTGQERNLTAVELMGLEAADFNAWVGEVSGQPGQYIPEARAGHLEGSMPPVIVEGAIHDEGIGPNMSAAQERARLINEFIPDQKFVLPTNLLRLGNQNKRQRKIFNDVMQNNIYQWIRQRQGGEAQVDGRDKLGVDVAADPRAVATLDSARDFGGESQNQGQLGASVLGPEYDATRQPIPNRGLAQVPDSVLQPAPAEILPTAPAGTQPMVSAEEQVPATVETQQQAATTSSTQQQDAAVDDMLAEFDQPEAEQAPLDDAGVERVANTIGDMFSDQGVEENQERIFETIETAKTGEGEAKITAQRDLLNIMSQLADGKIVAYEEHTWEPIPEEELEVKKLGDSFERLVGMGYLDNLSDYSSRDVRKRGLDPEAALQAAVEINRRRSIGEEVSREDMDNIIFEKHTGQERQVQRTSEPAVDAKKKGLKVDPSTQQVSPRSQMTPGEFVFSEPGSRGIAQIGKADEEEKRVEAVAKRGDRFPEIYRPEEAAPEPMRGDPVAQAEQGIRPGKDYEGYEEFRAEGVVNWDKEPNDSKLSQFMEEWNQIEKELPEGVKLHVGMDVRGDNKSIDIAIMEVSRAQRGQGKASKAIKMLTDLADKHDVIVTLDPAAKLSETGVGLGQNQLEAWYERSGWKKHSEQSHFLRRPQKPSSSAAQAEQAAPQEGRQPLFKSSSPSFDIELQQKAVDAFGDEAGAYINALKDLTDDQDIAQAITSLVAKNIGDSVDETIQNVLSNMEDLGTRTKEVDGRKVIDDTPITIKEASEPITPQTGPVVSEAEGVSWWGSLTENERLEHLREGFDLLRIQLKQAGLAGIDFLEYSVGMLTASRDDKFAGGVIGQIVPIAGTMSEVAAIEIYFTPGVGKDFGAFFADVIMKDDLSKEGYRIVSAASLLPSDWAKATAAGSLTSHSNRVKDHRAIIEDLIKEKMDFVISDRVKSFYSGPDGLFEEDIDNDSVPETLEYLLAQSEKYEKEFNDSMEDIIREVMFNIDSVAYDSKTGLVNLKKLAPFLERPTERIAEKFSDVDNIKDVFAAYIVKELPSAIQAEVIQTESRRAEGVEREEKKRGDKKKITPTDIATEFVRLFIEKGTEDSRVAAWYGDATDIEKLQFHKALAYLGYADKAVLRRRSKVDSFPGIIEEFLKYKDFRVRSTAPTLTQEQIDSIMVVKEAPVEAAVMANAADFAHVITLKKLADVDDVRRNKYTKQGKGRKREAGETAAGIIRKLYDAVPDFGFDPVFTVESSTKPVPQDSDFDLVYKDGAEYRFHADMFVSEERVNFKIGDRVAVDLLSFAFNSEGKPTNKYKPKTKEKVIKDLFKNYGFLRAKVKGNSISATNSNGNKIHIIFEDGGINIVNDGGSEAAAEEIKAFSTKLSTYSDEMLTGGDEEDVTDSPAGWNLPETEVNTSDVVPNLSVTGDTIIFTDREGNERTFEDFATPVADRVYLKKDKKKEKDISQKKTRQNPWSTGGWKNLPAADGDIDIDHILTIAPGLEYIGIQHKEGPDVHGFKAAHGEVLLVRAVKFIPSVGETVEATRVSGIQGIQMHIPGKKESHVIVISEMGLASPVNKDSGPELEEIIHWAQTTGRWSPEINDMLQKEFSKQALVSGVTRSDQIEDTAKGLAIAITDALKRGDPASVGPVRDIMKKVLEWFNDFLIGSGMKAMDVDYIVKKWLSGEIVGNPEFMVNATNVMRRQVEWKGRKKLTDEEREEIGIAAEGIDGMHEDVGPNTRSDAAQSFSDTMANRIGRLARIKRDVVKNTYKTLEPGRAQGAWTSIKSWLRKEFRVVPLEGAEARKELLKLAEEREGFAGLYSRQAQKFLKAIEKSKKDMGIESFSDKVKELMYIATKNSTERKELLDVLTSEISDKEQLNAAVKGVGEIQKLLGNLRDTMDELSRIVINDETQRSEQMAVILDKNLEVYVNRKYRLFEDPKGRKLFLTNTPEGKKLIEQAAKAARAIDYKKKYNKIKDNLFAKWRKGERPVGMKVANVIAKENEFKEEIEAGLHSASVDSDSTTEQVDDFVDFMLREWFMNEMESPEYSKRIAKKARKATISEQRSQDEVYDYLDSPTSGNGGSEGLARNTDQFNVRKDLDEAFKKLYGEIRGAEAVGISITTLASNIAGHNFQKSLVESALFDNHIDTKSGGNRIHKLIGREYGQLNGKYVTNEFKNAVERVTGQTGLLSGESSDSLISNLLYAVAGLSHASKGMKTIMNPKTATRNSIEEHVHAFMNGWWNPITNVFGGKENEKRALFRQALAIAENHADVDANPILKYIANPGLGNVRAIFGKTRKMDMSEHYDAEASSLHQEVSELGLLNNSLQKVWDEQRENLEVANPLDILTSPDTSDMKIDTHDRAEGVSSMFRRTVGKLTNNKLVKEASKLYQVPSDAVRVMGYVAEKANINKAIAWEVEQDLKGENMSKAEVAEAVKEMQEKRKKATNREAADKVKDLVPTASRVPRLVKDMSLIPVVGNFPVWFTGYVKSMTNQWKIGLAESMSKNEATSRVGLNRLMRATLTQAVWAGFARGMYMLFGFDDDDMEAIENSVPKYQRNHTLIPIPNPFGEGFSVFDVSQSFPSVMFMDWAATAGKSLKKDGISGVIGAGISEATSMFTDEDIFMSSVWDIFIRDGENKFGYKVWDSLDSTLIKGVKAIDHVTLGMGEGFRGPLSPGMIPELNRIVESVTGKETPSGIVRSPTGVFFRNMIGSEATGFVPKTMLTMKAKEFQEARRKYTRSLNKAGYSGNSSRFKSAIQEFEKNNSRLYNEMGSVIHAARLGGMEDGDIYQRLLKFNVPKTDIQHWMTGRVRSSNMSTKTLQGIFQEGGQEMVDVYVDSKKRGNRGE